MVLYILHTLDTFIYTYTVRIPLFFPHLPTCHRTFLPYLVHFLLPYLIARLPLLCQQHYLGPAWCPGTFVPVYVALWFGYTYRPCCNTRLFLACLRHYLPPLGSYTCQVGDYLPVQAFNHDSPCLPVANRTIVYQHHGLRVPSTPVTCASYPTSLLYAYSLGYRHLCVVLCAPPWVPPLACLLYAHTFLPALPPNTPWFTFSQPPAPGTTLPPLPASLLYPSSPPGTPRVLCLYLDFCVFGTLYWVPCGLTLCVARALIGQCERLYVLRASHTALYPLYYLVYCYYGLLYLPFNLLPCPCSVYHCVLFFLLPCPMDLPSYYTGLDYPQPSHT